MIVTPEEMLSCYKKNLKNLAILGSSSRDQFQEQQPAAIDGKVRWWRHPKYDLVRTADGGAWLLIPLGHVQHPPLFGLVYRNDPATVMEDLAVNGGVVIPDGMPQARKLELVFCAFK